MEIIYYADLDCYPEITLWVVGAEKRLKARAAVYGAPQGGQQMYSSDPSGRSAMCSSSRPGLSKGAPAARNVTLHAGGVVGACCRAEQSILALGLGNMSTQ